MTLRTQPTKLAYNKKCATAEKMFETLAILNSSLECCFFRLTLFLDQRKQICMWEDLFFDRQHSVAAIKDHDVSLDIFSKIPGQNKAKGLKTFDS
jgi:hypothetical protein